MNDTIIYARARNAHTRTNALNQQIFARIIYSFIVPASSQIVSTRKNSLLSFVVRNIIKIHKIITSKQIIQFIRFKQKRANRPKLTLFLQPSIQFKRSSMRGGSLDYIIQHFHFLTSTNVRK